MDNRHITTLHYNNNGSRWNNYYSCREIVPVEFKTKTGKTIIRKPRYYEAFGNFVVVAINYKGRIIKVFPDEILDD